MGTLGDIVGLLEKIPVWRELKTLPDRVKKLEEELAALKNPARESVPAVFGKRCPKCGAMAFQITAERPHELYGETGTKSRDRKCANCGWESLDLAEDPAKD